ncbi:MAG: type II toxin-antitoxin system prevent-host-death family antitoxin [Candidatus Omnitrophica bacterium]|nr:type II toxin-antitoxin system prevent-host-death family antitoxin [Candidatus Omnitrophota bacterium]
MNMPAGVFKAKCLKLMDEIRLSHKEVVITKRGLAVAKLVPVEPFEKKPLFGLLKNSVKAVKGDLVPSLKEEWHAER